MDQDKKVFDLKMTAPWYDAEPVCYIQIVFAVLVFLFGIAGVLVAGEYAGHPGYMWWIPVTLMGMSVFLFLSTVIRLAKRIHYRSQNKYLVSIQK